MNAKKWHVCVLVPAKNEEELLPRCLKSILLACRQVQPYSTTDIVLCVDSSTDKTYTIGTQLLKNNGCVIEIAKECVGSARKQAALIALQRYKGPLQSCWLSNTDADCEVPLNWLSNQLAWASKGVHGVSGTVRVDNYDEHEAGVAEIFLNNYTINPDGTHPHIHGANLGIRADVYQKIGGWFELETAEDHDLWNRLLLLNFKKISDANLYVCTSGRKIGRAPHGFANYLATCKEINNKKI